MRLDEAEDLSIGSGRLDLFGFGQGWDENGKLGIGLNYEHRLNQMLSGFAEAKIAKEWGERERIVWDAMFGGRITF